MHTRVCVGITGLYTDLRGAQLVFGKDHCYIRSFRFASKATWITVVRTPWPLACTPPHAWTRGGDAVVLSLCPSPHPPGGAWGWGAVRAAASSPPPLPSAATTPHPRHSCHHSDNTQLKGLGEIDAHFPMHGFVFLQRSLRFCLIASLISSHCIANGKHRRAQ